MRFLRILVAALVAWLGFAPSGAAVPLPESTMAIYTYDASWHVAPPLSAATERGPPADEDTDTTPDAVDRRSHGASTRRQARELRTSTTYDASRSLVQVDSGTATTQGRAGVDARDLRPLLSAMVAAKNVTSGWRSGRELSLGKNLRVSLGQKGALKKDGTPNRPVRLPHYHRGKYDSIGNPLKGQGFKRHRPWETKSNDSSFGDRF